MSVASTFFPNSTPLYLLDASAFIYRGFYAYSSMQRKDAFPTSAIYSVARVLLKLLLKENPTYCAFVMDGAKKSFRNDIYPLYKQNRSKTPEHLLMQIEPIITFVRLLGIPLVTATEGEADDYIASLSKQYENEGVIILGVDKDLRQCLSEGVLMWDPSSKEEKIITKENFMEESGLLPSQWADFQAIIGDSSDNIPGVKGIGEKTAKKIFEHYQSLEDIEKNIDSLEPKIQQKLRPEMHNAYIYRELTRLSFSCCLLDKKELFLQRPQKELLDFVQEYELYSIKKDVEKLCNTITKNKNTSDNATSTLTQKISSPQMLDKEQLSLFAVHSEYNENKNIEDAIENTTTKISISSLPPCDNMRVILHLQENLLITLHGITYSITDDISSQYISDSLYLYLSKAKECITVDAKTLFTQIPSLLSLSHKVHDIAIMAYLLSPEEREYTAQSLYARFAEHISPTNTMMDFIDAIALFFMEQLSAKDLLPMYITIEQPLCAILVRMEQEGIRLDIEALHTFLHTVQEELEVLEKSIYAFAGREFNIRSSQQLGILLFDELKLEKKSKTKTGLFSTSQENLEKLRSTHPIIETLLEYRKLEKLRSTYLEPLPKRVDEHNRIHTTFNQLATATGRLSSSNPNLQNIPIRGALGQKMRTCFCAKQGYTLVVVDYSQIELRILAYYSKEPTLVEAFTNNEDIHKRTASVLYQVPLEEVTKEQRQNAKAVNFGLLYGMGANKLATEMGIKQNQAKEFIATYFEKLPKVKELHAHIIESATEQGYVTSLFGRRRYLPDIQSGNQQLSSQARRQAVNTVIQGTAADIIKKAMVDIANNPIYASMGATLILQVHDELIVEVPENNANTIAQSMKHDMTNISCNGILLPLVVDIGIAKTWGDAH